jgi:hypothetical protein
MQQENYKAYSKTDSTLLYYTSNPKEYYTSLCTDTNDNIYFDIFSKKWENCTDDKKVKYLEGEKKYDGKKDW